MALGIPGKHSPTELYTPNPVKVAQAGLDLSILLLQAPKRQRVQVCATMHGFSQGFLCVPFLTLLGVRQWGSLFETF